MLKLYNKLLSFFAYLRGFIFKNLFLRGKCGSKFRLSIKTIIKGEVTIGNNVSIGSFSKIYLHVKIKDNVTIGDNVELRCNGESHIDIGDGVSINRNSMIIGLVTIGKDCAIAPGCVIVGSNHVFEDIDVRIKDQGLSRKGIRIGNDVWVGANTVILDGVEIGDKCIIGAGSVVTKSIKSQSIAVGNPCKVIKFRD